MYRHPPGLRGFLLAVTLLGGGMATAFALGAAAFWALESAAIAAGRPDGVPNWWILVTSAAFLLAILVFLGRTFRFPTDWYYLLPAIVFLLVFTVYPIVLTIYLAFTDYSGMRNGFPDRSTETPVVAVDGPRITLGADPLTSLGCGETCVGQQLKLVGDGHRARFSVVDASGRTLTLDRAPGFAPEYAYRINAYRFIGFKNFVFIFKNASKALWPVFVWNVVFAAFTMLSTELVGLILGVLLNNRELKLRNLYRTLLIVSWALPGVISIQMWVALLNKQFGAINRLLGLWASTRFPGCSTPWYPSWEARCTSSCVPRRGAGRSSTCITASWCGLRSPGRPAAWRRGCRWWSRCCATLFSWRAASSAAMATRARCRVTTASSTCSPPPACPTGLWGGSSIRSFPTASETAGPS